MATRSGSRVCRQRGAGWVQSCISIQRSRDYGFWKREAVAYLMPRAQSRFLLLRAVIRPPGSWMVVGCIVVVASGFEAVDVQGCDEYSVRRRNFIKIMTWDVLCFQRHASRRSSVRGRNCVRWICNYTSRLPNWEVGELPCSNALHDIASLQLGNKGWPGASKNTTCHVRAAPNLNGSNRHC